MRNPGFTLFLVIMLSSVFLSRVFEMYFLETGKAGGRKYASWTKRIFGLVYFLIIVSSLAEYFIFKRDINIFVTATGLVLLAIKMPIKFWAAKSLGKYWSHQVEISPEHKLIKTGPYKHIRHPVYLSAVLDTLGIPLLANAYYTIGPAIIMRFLAILIRMRIEEKALIEKFGEEYIKYKNETGAVIPRIKKNNKKGNYENIIDSTTN